MNDDLRVSLDAGSLSVREMRTILESFPADVTFADADNLIQFYTGRYRIFSRSPKIIGTSVIDCHSSSSREAVAALISELKDGVRSEATFIEEKDGRPVHVQYIPIWDSETYVGILEVVQWVDQIAG